MIPGSRGGRSRPLRAVVFTLAAAACAVVPALPAAAAATSADHLPGAPSTPSVGGSWGTAWSWAAGAAGLPAACAATRGATGGVRFSTAGVDAGEGGVRISPAGRGAAAGITCRTRSQGSGRVVLRVLLPAGPGVVTRFGVSATPAGTGATWCGLTVPGGGAATAAVTSYADGDAETVRLPARPAGVARTFTLTWTPSTFTVLVDGRGIHPGRDDAPSTATPTATTSARWLSIAVTVAGSSPASDPLVVTALTVQTPRAAAVPGEGASLPPVTGVAPAAAVVPEAGEALLGQVGSEVAGRLPTTVTSLPTTTLPGPWLLVGACAAVGVLFGVLRAAVVARRRPVTSS